MIIKKFEEQVVKFSDNIAIRTGSGVLTYGELNKEANRIAHRIKRRLQQAPESENPRIAALLYDDCPGAVKGILGALKADIAFLILETSYPENRLIYMLEHSGAFIILTNRRNLFLAERLRRRSTGSTEVLNMDNTTDSEPVENIDREPTKGRIAYILYTSGSTGNPKGVIQNHGNVVYFVNQWIKKFSISSSDRMTMLSSLSHDAAVMDIFGALLAGAALYPNEIINKANGMELSTWLKREKITVWHSVPTMYRYFVNSISGKVDTPLLRFIVLGGEQVRMHDVRLYKELFPGSIFVNLYGQTESSLNSLWFFNRVDPLSRVKIGEPVEGMKVLLVNKNGEEVEKLETGEIIIASEHVALGYWKDAESTAKAFSIDKELGRIYWTGDMGRLLPDGSIEYMGRQDSQVKIRGHRVEIGEIETTLLKHETVKEVAVVTKEVASRKTVSNGGDINYELRLFAYFVADQKCDVSEMREFLYKELPGYMIPSKFIQLIKMPLTTTNKIDRKALSEQAGFQEESESTYVEPQTYMEQKIAEIWKEVLDLDKVGLHDNFFELGGNSLNFIEVDRRLKEAFNRDIPFGSMFRYPTISTFAQQLSKEKNLGDFSDAEIDWFTNMNKGKSRLMALKGKRIK